jgi:hypothetical protein
MGEQYLSTSRLGNVMRLIALGRQTGLLRVVRGQGATREEGEVQFIDGQIAMATVGQLTGGAAVAVLQNWGESFYLFLDGVNRLQQGSTSSNLGGWGNTNSDSLPPTGSGSYPASNFGASNPPNTPTGYPSQSGSFNNQSYPPQPGYNSQSNYGPQSGYGPPQDYGTPSNPNMNSGYPSGSMPNGADSGSFPGQPRAINISPQVMQKLTNQGYVLRRLTATNPAEMPSLDRRERQMLLLVDNRRTIADLIRLTRRGNDEIRAILAHLIALGLVE